MTTSADARIACLVNVANVGRRNPEKDFAKISGGWLMVVVAVEIVRSGDA